MALKISLDSTQAVKDVKQVRNALGSLSARIARMRKAYASIDILPLKQAKEAIDALAKSRITNPSQNSAISQQSELIKKQTEDINALTVSLAKSSTESAKSSGKLNEKKKALTELEKIEKKAKIATEQTNLATSDGTGRYVKATNSIERNKAVLTGLKAEQNRQKLASDAATQATLKSTEGHKANTQTIRDSVKASEKLKLAKNAETLAIIRKTQEDKKAYNELTKGVAKTKESSKSVDESAMKIKKLTEENKKLSQSIKMVTTSTRDFSSSLKSGNIHAAEFRAGLNAMGLGFGVFTGSTIVAAAAVYGAVRAIRATITAGAEFEFTMDRANAVMNTTVQEGMLLESAVKNLAETTIFTAGEVSKGLVFLGMAGFSANEALMALEPTLRLAQIGMIGMEQAADLVTNIMAGFNLEAFQITDTVDKLSVVVTSSNTSITQLAQAMSLVGPIAANTNTTLEDTTAIIGYFANAGIKATRAGTALRRGLSNLANPTEDISARMFDLGIKITASDGRMRSMVDIMGEMREAGANVSDILEIFGTRAGPAFAAAVLSGSDGIKELIKAQKEAEGTTKALTSVIEDNAFTDAKILVSALHRVFIDLYETMDGSVRLGLQTVTSGLKGISTVLAQYTSVIKLAATATITYASAILLLKLKSYYQAMLLVNGATSAYTLATNLAARSTAFFATTATALRAAFVFMTGPIGSIVTAVGILAAAFIFAKDSSKELSEELEKSKRSSQGFDKLFSKSGIGGTTEATDSLKRVINARKDLEASLDKSKTLGEILSEGVSQATEDVKEYQSQINELSEQKIRIEGRVQGASTSSTGAINVISQQIKALKMQQQVAKGRLEAIKLREEELVLAAAQYDIDNAGSLTQIQLLRAITLEKTRQKEEGEAIIRAERIKQTLLKKDLQLNEAKKNLTSALSPIQTLEEGEKSRTKRINELKALISNGIGDSDNLAKELKEKLDQRASLINQLTEKINTLGSNARLSINEIRTSEIFGDTEISQALKSAGADKEAIDKIREQFNELKKLVKVQEKDLNDVLLQSINTKQAQAKEARDKELALVDLNNKTHLKLIKDRGAVEQSLNQLKYSSGLIGLKEFTEKEAEISQRVNQEKLRIASENVTRLSQLSLALEEQNKSLGKNSNQSKEVNSQMKETNKQLTQQTILVGALNGVKITKEQLDNRAVDLISTELANIASANVQLQAEIINRTLNNGIKRDSILLSVNQAIVNIDEKEAAGELTEALAEQRLELIKQKDIYIDRKEQLKDLNQEAKLQANSMEKIYETMGKNMQSSLADFFIDPSKDAFDSLGDSFAKLVQRMLAEQLALKLFEGINGGKNGDGGLINGLISGISSYFGNSSGATNTSSDYTGSAYQNFINGTGGSAATGGSFKVRGSGGIDSVPVSFMASPGENVTVSNPNGGDDRAISRMNGGGQNFNNVVNITVASGVSQEEVRATVGQGLQALEGKLIRQTQKRGRPAGVR